MNKEEVNDDSDYKKLYFDLKEKYDKLKTESEELRTENKIKDIELQKLRKNPKDELMKLNLNYLDKKDIANLDNNSVYKNNSKKYETYSVDSFRNEVEHNNDLINDLIKIDADEINRNSSEIKNLMKIENSANFQIISNKKNIKSLIFDIDEILLNIKKKQESLHQTEKMLNIKIDNKD